jgi:hypothetical protein
MVLVEPLHVRNETFEKKSTPGLEVGSDTPETLRLSILAEDGEKTVSHNEDEREALIDGEVHHIAEDGLDKPTIRLLIQDLQHLCGQIYPGDRDTSFCERNSYPTGSYSGLESASTVAGQPFQKVHSGGIYLGIEPVVVVRPGVAVYPLQVRRRALVLHVDNLVVESRGIVRMLAPAPAPTPLHPSD